MKTFKIRCRLSFLTLMGMLACATLCPLQAAVLVVPPDTLGHVAATPYDTWENAATDIQTAVTYAEANAITEVWVSKGLYVLTGYVTVSGGIYLRSYNEGQIDTANTVVDGANAHLGFFLNHADAVLDGFTVTNCNFSTIYDDGSAVLIYEGATVRNCDFKFNRRTSYATLRGGTVGMRGGRVENCNFQENWVVGFGGGITMSSGTMLVTNCTFNGNYASNTGGGIAATGGTGYIVDCVFSNNVSERGGGYGDNGTWAPAWDLLVVVIDRCVFDSNIATNDGSGGDVARGGAGLRIGNNATVTLRNSLITRNRAINIYGGGVSLYQATDSWIENCTIVSNYAQQAGGGIGVGTWEDKPYTGVGIRNTIVYDNWSDAAGWDSLMAYANRLIWTNNCVDTAMSLNDFGAGNLLQSAPRFVNPAANDWRLLQGSPYVDSGDTLDWMTTAKDLDGARRIHNGVVDMGCYESAYSLGSVLVVK